MKWKIYCFSCSITSDMCDISTIVPICVLSPRAPSVGWADGWDMQEVHEEGEGAQQIGMDMYTFCEALGPEEVR